MIFMQLFRCGVHLLAFANHHAEQNQLDKTNCSSKNMERHCPIIFVQPAV